ncbi:hypothetical protein AABM34_13460 [Lysinibacillus fusiformis]
MNKDHQGKFLMFSAAIKEDGTLLELKGISFSRDEQYVVETTQFEDYNGKAKIFKLLRQSYQEKYLTEYSFAKVKMFK